MTYPAAGNVGVGLPPFGARPTLSLLRISYVGSQDPGFPLGDQGDHVLPLRQVRGTIAHIRGDDDLVFTVDDDLSIVGLDEGFLVRHDP